MLEDKKDPKIEGEDKKDVPAEATPSKKVDSAKEGEVKETKTETTTKEDEKVSKNKKAKEDVSAKAKVKEDVPAEAKAKEGKSIPDLKPGMTIRVYQKIKELNIKGEEKERTQYFEGMIIAKKHGKEIGGTITVRKVSDGVGVEKIFPLNLPTITKIEIKKQAKVRRAKLNYLKDGYKKRLKEKKIA